LPAQFFSYIGPDIEGFEQVVAEFKDRVPELAKGLAHKIKEAQKSNRKAGPAIKALAIGMPLTADFCDP
jgi:hypothetical protein